MNMRRERKFSLLKHKERKKRGRGKCVSRMKYFCIVDDLKKKRIYQQINQARQGRIIKECMYELLYYNCLDLICVV